ncbi:hypothetical protein H919_12508 [Anoxybacillus flavithermus AK1]|uniref:Uncharacterized protein n=1 Tax=Anoxybacillus flavithermus AK1 TaxID=1297581 RepID=M8DKQ8_9BACL|nr:hypothetical protein H919_12508 [Anoxybacillus flavithermus AK1]
MEQINNNNIFMLINASIKFLKIEACVVEVYFDAGIINIEPVVLDKVLHENLFKMKVLPNALKDNFHSRALLL